jgi:alpha-ketoglutarate-dependent taurine dioxygenase
MGAVIEGVDLSRQIDDDAFDAIRDAFVDHHLIVFRGQSLDRSHMRQFAERFGTIEGNSIKGHDGRVLDPVHEVSNLDADGNPSKKPHINANYYWHSDKAHLPVPSLLTMLYAVELPPVGGETEFANTALAYDALPASIKTRIASLHVENDFQYAMQNVGKKLTEAEEVPPAVHPLVRIHPDTGASCLFVGMYAKRIVEMPVDEGQAMIKGLLDHVTQPSFTYRHPWQVGDLVVWDNRCLLHRAIMNYEMTAYRRVLLRCVVRGTPSA